MTSPIKEEQSTYLIKRETENLTLYKIGKSLNPLGRLNSLSSTQPDLYSIAACSNKVDIESDLHNKYAKYIYNKGGRGTEWFLFPDDIVKEIIITLQNLSNPAVKALTSVKENDSLKKNDSKEEAKEEKFYKIRDYWRDCIKFLTGDFKSTIEGIYSIYLVGNNKLFEEVLSRLYAWHFNDPSLHFAIDLFSVDKYTVFADDYFDEDHLSILKEYKKEWDSIWLPFLKSKSKADCYRWEYCPIPPEKLMNSKQLHIPYALSCKNFTQLIAYYS